MRTLPRWAWHAGGWSLLLAMLLLAFSVGQFPVRPAALLHAIGWQLFGIGDSPAPAVQAALWHIRLPRVLAAVARGGENRPRCEPDVSVPPKAQYPGCN